jgi:hypothetical protein
VNRPEIAKALRAFIDEVEAYAHTSRGRRVAQSILACQGCPPDADDAEAEYRELVTTSKVVRSGWELVDQLRVRQLDIQNLRRFLHFLDHDKQASAWDLWCSLMPELEASEKWLTGDAELPILSRNLAGRSTLRASMGCLSDVEQIILQAIDELKRKGRQTRSIDIAGQAGYSPGHTRRILAALKKRQELVSDQNGYRRN